MSKITHSHAGAWEPEELSNRLLDNYALHQNTQPLGVAEYQLIESLPPELATDLPSIEQELIGHNANTNHAGDEP